MESCISYPVADCLHTKLILLPYLSCKPSFYRHINSLSFQTMEQSWNFSIPEFYPPMVSPLFLPRCISTAIQRLKFPNEGSCTLKAAQSKAIRVLGTKHRLWGTLPALVAWMLYILNTAGPSITVIRHCPNPPEPFKRKVPWKTLWKLKSSPKPASFQNSLKLFNVRKLRNPFPPEPAMHKHLKPAVSFHLEPSGMFRTTPEASRRQYRTLPPGHSRSGERWPNALEMEALGDGSPKTSVLQPLKSQAHGEGLANEAQSCLDQHNGKHPFKHQSLRSEVFGIQQVCKKSVYIYSMMSKAFCPAEVPGTSWGCGDWPHRLLLPAADAVKEHRKILIRPRRKSREEEAC